MPLPAMPKSPQMSRFKKLPGSSTSSTAQPPRGNLPKPLPVKTEPEEGRLGHLERLPGLKENGQPIRPHVVEDLLKQVLQKRAIHATYNDRQKQAKPLPVPKGFR